jgi:hypothetical protein
MPKIKAGNAFGGERIRWNLEGYRIKPIETRLGLFGITIKSDFSTYRVGPFAKFGVS